MKLLFLLLLATNLSWAACLKPGPRVAKAFATIQGKGDLKAFLEKNLVAKSAQNQNCETMYLFAIRARDEKSRKYLESISYDEKATFVYSQTDFHSQPIMGPEIEDVTPLNYALRYGSLATVRELITRARTEQNWYEKDLAISLAAAFSTLDVVKYLVEEEGADVNDATNDYWTPFLRAAKSNSVPVLKYLVEKKADIHYRTFFGTNAVDAARENAPEVKKYLKGLGLEPSTGVLQSF